ncbi:MAG TPA: cytochrome P450 [Acidimicrobiales bacterium]|nr:cytochrome P450 [Acidimicrobiales bacterium]
MTIAERRPTIDLYSAASFDGGQPHDQFDWLRAHEPVHRHPTPDGGHFWALTRYDDVRAVGRDAATFSSEPTIMLADPDPATDMGDHKMMLMADPPVHTRMRRMVSGQFTPKAARALRPRIQDLAGQIVDEVIERGECDLVVDIAGEMPSFVIAELLGIPLDDGRELYHLTETLHAASDAVGIEAQQAAFGQMFGYAQQVYAHKREHPGDDLATLLATGALDDHPVDEVDFFLWFLLLVDAGGDTTRNLVGGGLHALFEHPAELRRLHADVDGLLPAAIEELLRYVSPVVYMRRRATRPVVLHGAEIAEGDKVVMYYGAANRDPAAFDRPHELDLGRHPNHHVAFGGGGPHFCLGAHIARLEIEALLREVLTRLEGLEPTAEPQWLASNFISGPTHLPVRFRSGPRTGS